MQQAFFDVTAISPIARSTNSKPVKTLFQQGENRKNREHRARVVQVDHGAFQPLVFVTSGGMAPAATMVTKRLGSLIATRRDMDFSVVMGWLRTRISFALLRTVLICLRGTRARRVRADDSNIELAVHEAKMDRA